MIDRRSLLAVTGATAAVFPAAAGASAVNGELSNARSIIEAFYLACNADNWSFVNEILEGSFGGNTNHSHWLPWAMQYHSQTMEEAETKGPKGFLNSDHEIYDFLRSRQFKAGWSWHLPMGKESIWQVDQNLFAVFATWQRMDGGDYQIGVLDMSPRFIHLFSLKREEEFEVTISRRINTFQEIDVARAQNG